MEKRIVSPKVVFTEEQLQVLKDKLMKMKCNKMEYTWYTSNEHVLQRMHVNGMKEIREYDIGRADGIIRLYKKYEKVLKMLEDFK